MKKIYSTLALAACVCLSASALKPGKVMHNLQGELSVNEMAHISASKKYKKAAPQKAASVKDFTGFFKCVYDWPFTSEDQAGQLGVTATIEDAGNNQVAVSIYPFIGGYSNVDITPLVGDVNPADGSITFTMENNEGLGIVEYPVTPGSAETEPYEVDFFCGTWVENGVDEATGKPKYTLQPQPSITGYLQADGSVEFGEEFFGFKTGNGGFMWGAENLKFVDPGFFKYNAAEWESVGSASYEEYVFNPLLQSPVPAVDVPLYRNVKNHSELLLMKPYSVSPWDQLNSLPNADGFIQFNIYGPECVTVRPLTDCGLWIDWRETEAEPENFQNYYVFNLEGYYLFRDKTIEPEDITEIFPEEGYDLSTYDEDTRVVDVLNVFFGVSNDPLNLYRWTDQQTNKSIPLSFKITLPENIDLGVNNLVDDSENAPARYFNLQGMELRNPANGQVVIVKNGNKTSKRIF